MGNDALRPPLPVVTIMHNNRPRTYSKFTYSCPAAADTLVIIVMLHGGGGTGASMRRLTNYGFETLSTVTLENSMVAPAMVLYPDGLDHHWNDDRLTHPTIVDIDDVGFIRAMVEKEKQEIQGSGFLFGTRIKALVTGMSNGGMMCFRLAREASDVFDCVAPVAGLLPVPKEPPLIAWAKPIPMILIVGTADTLVPYAGGPIGRLRLPTTSTPNRWQERIANRAAEKRGSCMSAAETIGFVLTQNRLEQQPTSSVRLPSVVADGTVVDMFDYNSRAEISAPFRLFVVQDGGHTWPGGMQYSPKILVGNVSNNLNACEAIWSFFHFATTR
eukprot:TRINITY_DN5540_c0_g1_i1.p1 TRINITY_DN5540_c0_g1~~TRINITY_DN5540_c0_g1_i1.p1  ORF type:complete len:357 (+),score=45.15 TRINITY_DN5540_c0_g1_i1:86-1072(+)